MLSSIFRLDDFTGNAFCLANPSRKKRNQLLTYTSKYQPETNRMKRKKRDVKYLGQISCFEDKHRFFRGSNKSDD